MRLSSDTDEISETSLVDVEEDGSEPVGFMRISETTTSGIVSEAVFCSL